jgi:hypothetical protein
MSQRTRPQAGERLGGGREDERPVGNWERNGAWGAGERRGGLAGGMERDGGATEPIGGPQEKTGARGHAEGGNELGESGGAEGRGVVPPGEGAEQETERPEGREVARADSVKASAKTAAMAA